MSIVYYFNLGSRSHMWGCSQPQQTHGILRYSHSNSNNPNVSPMTASYK